MKDQPAFPLMIAKGQGGITVLDGMTMRQFYKAAALQGLMAYVGACDPVKGTAQLCGTLADAMCQEDEEHEAKKS